MKELSSRLSEEVANATKAMKRETAKLQARVSNDRTEATVNYTLQLEMKPL